MTATRRLAAILAVDVAGYSRLMGADEEGTLERLKAHRREVTDPKIKEYRGRIVKLTGDGALVEFPSVVDAVRCAVEIQRAIVDRNADVPEDQCIAFRIGVNLGDVILDGGDIYGEGVNIAARLEALAEPGGICISRVVRDQIRDKLPYPFEDIGEQTVKKHRAAGPGLRDECHCCGVDTARGAGAVQSGQSPTQPAARDHSSKRRCNVGHWDRGMVGVAQPKFADSNGPGACGREPTKYARRRWHPGAAPVDRRPSLYEPVE